MVSTKQVQAAKRNIRRAQRAARAKKTITKLPVETRRDLGRQAAKARQRGGKPGRALEDRTRQQLYEVAKKKGVPGRSKMGKWDLIKAIRKAGLKRRALVPPNPYVVRGRLNAASSH